MFITALSLFSEFLLVLFALLLWVKSSLIQRANRMLAGTFLLLAVLNLWMLLLSYIYKGEMDFLLPWYLPLDQVLVMFIGPSIYFYVLLLFDPTRRITAWQFSRHALPALPAMAYAGYFISLPLSQRTEVLLDASPWMDNLLDYFFYFQLLPYLVVCFLKVHKQRKANYLLETNDYRINIRWLYYALGLALAGIVGHLPLCMAENCNEIKIILGTVIIILLVGYIFLLSLISNGLSMQNQEEIVCKPERRVKLDMTLVNVYLERLHRDIVVPMIYLNPECTLETVAQQMDISQHHLSYVINEHCGKNFSDFINEYRCCYACQLLNSEEVGRMTIEAIGLQSGFRTRVNFHHAFKKCYGKSPFDYQNELKKKKGMGEEMEA